MAIYPHGLCEAICRGLATQLHENKIGKVRTLPMDAQRLLSISMAFQQSTGGYPPEIVNGKGAYSLSGIQFEVDGQNEPTGKFRRGPKSAEAPSRMTGRAW